MPEEAVIAAGSTEETGAIATEEAPVETEVQTETPVEQETEQTEQAETTQSKTSTDPVKDALNKMRESDPKVSATLRKEHFENLDFRKIGTPAELRALKESFDLVGGEEGIQQLQSDAEEFAQTLTRVANGDPSILDEIISDSRDGFLKLASESLNRARQVDSQKYESMLIPHFATLLKEKGVSPLASRALKYIQEGKQQEAYDLTKEIVDWMAGLEQSAQQSQQRREDDPRDKELREREEKLRNEEQNSYHRKVGEAANGQMRTTISKSLAPYFKAKPNLTREQRADLESGVYTEISNSLKGNQRYQQQLQAHLKKGSSPEDIARFVNSYVDSMAPAAVKAVWARRGFGATNGAKPQQKSSTTVVVMNKPPNSEDVDWSKDRDRMRHMSGEATLKSGKVVKWDWSKV